jgi:imidazolonepropionase
MPLAYRDDPAGYIEYLCAEFLPLLRRRRLAVFADIVCEEGLFSLAQIRRYLECARSFDYPVRLHLEGPSTAGAVQAACEAGATSVDHADYLSEDEISMLGAANTMATLIPGANFYRGGGRYPQARALIEAGVAVALASGFSPDSSPTGSMQMAVAIACSQMRMTPAEAISAATINGAHALGIAGHTGSLEPEKQADLLIMNASDYREVPFYFGVNQVYVTVKRGEAVYVENEVTGLHGL